MGSTDDSSFDQKLKDKSESVKPKVKKTDQDNGTDNEQSLKKPEVSSKSYAIPVVAGGRPRHDSNSSSDSARSPSTDRLKRRRTTSLSTSPLSSFFFPSSASFSPNSPSASPLLSSSPSFSSTYAASSSSPSNPSLMSLDEVMNAVNGVTNMALAHEIALDSNFKLEKFEPPQASLEKQVRDVMHQAFWDNLREQLHQNPPVYTQAFVLLQEVRDQLLEITLPHQKKLRQEISEKLDVDLIKQQAEHGVLDFGEYSAYVVNLMGKLCAPVRDEAIRKLKQETDVVSVFCGVAETLDLMKLDMANYTIQMIRPTIMKQIVEYEREKFKQFIQTQSDGLELTRKWILKHVDRCLEPNENDEASTAPTPSSLLSDPLALRSFSNTVLNRAFMELLQWPQDTLVPETVCVDSERVLELRDRLHQVCLLASVMLVALSTLSQQRPTLNSSQDQLKATLKKDLCPILDPAFTQSETLAALPNLVEQVIASLQSFLKEHEKEPLDTTVITALKTQLSDLQDSQHRITTLITQRCLAFFRQILSSPTTRTNLPTPFLILQEEVARIWSSFLRLTQHNRAVFGEYYFDMTEKRIKEKEAKKSSPETKSADSANAHDKPKDIRWDALDLD